MKETEEKKCKECEEYERRCCNRHYGMHHKHYGHGGGGAVYGLGFIGALVFFISHATSFWMGVLGFFQAIVWPAFLVYEAFKVLIK